MVVKNPERWLKPTTSDQCGQNHVNIYFNSKSMSSLQSQETLVEKYISENRERKAKFVLIINFRVIRRCFECITEIWLMQEQNK